jgi:hypothetical protein
MWGREEVGQWPFWEEVGVACEKKRKLGSLKLWKWGGGEDSKSELYYLHREGRRTVTRK